MMIVTETIYARIILLIKEVLHKINLRIDDIKIMLFESKFISVNVGDSHRYYNRILFLFH